MNVSKDSDILTLCFKQNYSFTIISVWHIHIRILNKLYSDIHAVFVMFPSFFFFFFFCLFMYKFILFILPCCEYSLVYVVYIVYILTTYTKHLNSSQTPLSFYACETTQGIHLNGVFRATHAHCASAFARNNTSHKHTHTHTHTHTHVHILSQTHNITKKVDC